MVQYTVIRFDSTRAQFGISTVTGTEWDTGTCGFQLILASASVPFRPMTVLMLSLSLVEMKRITVYSILPGICYFLTHQSSVEKSAKLQRSQLANQPFGRVPFSLSAGYEFESWVGPELGTPTTSERPWGGLFKVQCFHHNDFFDV